MARKEQGVAIGEEADLRLPDAQMERPEVLRQDLESDESFHLAKDCSRIERFGSEKVKVNRPPVAKVERETCAAGNIEIREN